jgi:predicted enzyme related to lactoylglutathione lyase
MIRTTGIGGIFFKARDPQALAAWYQRHLGVPVQSWGGAVFNWADDPLADQGRTVWSTFPADTGHFGPGGAAFMVNFRVADLDALLAQLRTEACAVDDQVEVSDMGRFGWVTDPEGNRVELWQPPAGG